MMDIPVEIAEQSPETRAALVAALLATLAEETAYEDDYGGSPGRVVRAAALDYLTRTGTLSLACTVRWHEGCHCHGSSEQETLEESTLAEMGRALAQHNHADGSDIGETRWVLTLKDNEEEAIRSAYNLETTKAARVAKAKEVLGKAQADLESATSVVNRLQASLDSVRHELTLTAIATREAEIRRAQEAVEALRLVVGEARTALVAIA